VSKFTEETLTKWTKPPSDTEESKVENAISMVKDAIQNDEKLKNKSIEIFAQGSYANNTNVRVKSDIDINVRYTDGYFFSLPDNTKESDIGLDKVSSSTYKYDEFKNDVENAMIKKFGNDRVDRRDKCINIEEDSYIVDTDVVPTWNFKRFDKNADYILGARFFSDLGKTITNYPKQHIQKGKEKNKETSRKFKRLTRLHRKLRYKMKEENIEVNENITSFLLECLVWNVPNKIINDNDKWNDLLRKSIFYIYDKTNKEEDCTEWGEVSELLYLFRSSRKWSYSDVNEYMKQLWNYLEYK